jgi:hypothetical protein
MNIKRILLLALFFFSICFLVPKNSKAVDLQEALTSENSILLKIQEGVEYFFAFRIENKVQVLEKQAEKRLAMAQNYADSGNNDKVQNSLQNYLQIKERQNNLLVKIDSGEVLGNVEERTIEQQKTMEEIKTKINEDGKQNVIQVQEQVVNQVAKRVVEVNGTEGQTQFLNEVVHVWAPGTGPGGESGVVYAGGGKLIYASGTGPGGSGGIVIEGGEMKFAPGTSAGGSSGADIKTVEVKTGGVVEDSLPSGVTRGDGGTAVDSLAPGTTNSSEGGGNDSGTWTIDP